MFLERFQAVVHLRAHLAWVAIAILHHRILGTIFSAISHMLLGLPLGPECLLTAWTLIVQGGVRIRVVLSLLPKFLFKNLGVLRLFGIHGPCILFAFGRTVILPFDRLLGLLNNLLLLDNGLLLMSSLSLL